MAFEQAAILFLLGVVLSGINGASLQACPIAIRDIPQHYVREFDDYCFEFVHTERTWQDARNDCKTRGGDLVEVANENMQNFLYTTLKNDLHWNWHGVWIGATDHDSEKTWMWVRSGQNVTWNKWHPGEGPHHTGGFLFVPNAEAEDCAQMRLEDGGAWHDYRCNGIGIHYSYVCQYDKVYPSGQPVQVTASMTTSIHDNTHGHGTDEQTTIPQSEHTAMHAKTNSYVTDEKATTPHGEQHTQVQDITHDYVTHEQTTVQELDEN